MCRRRERHLKSNNLCFPFSVCDQNIESSDRRVACTSAPRKLEATKSTWFLHTVFLFLGSFM